MASQEFYHGLVINLITVILIKGGFHPTPSVYSESIIPLLYHFFAVWRPLTPFIYGFSIIHLIIILSYTE